MQSNERDNIDYSPKRLAVLGSTGSIGTQTLDVCRESGGKLLPEVLIAGRNVDLLASQCRQWKPALAVIADPELEGELRRRLDGSGVEVRSGREAVADAMQLPEVDTVVTATVGYSGLAPTLKAIDAGKEIALANKETLVVAGDLVKRRLQKSTSRILPVDSEHSAIYQCLVGEHRAEVRRLLITASGGPFRTWSRERIAEATLEDALRHPNWQMGAKITVDSSTMVNKAFEIIEAHWLFDIAPDRIRALVHPQSIIHSMVEFADGSVKAQLGMPDMRGPIRYALAGGRHPRCAAPAPDFATLGSLTFEEPDVERFPGVTLGHLALERGGLTACIINAANEIAVASFLNREIRYSDIYPLIINTLESMSSEDIPSPEYEDYVECNDAARRRASEIVTSRSYSLSLS